MLDLDGTTIDSKDAIVDSAMRILESLNVEGLSEEIILRSIGLPIEVVFGQVLSGENLAVASKAFRDDLLLRGGRKTQIYPEVEEFLAAAKQVNMVLAVVTNKPKPLAENILNELGILHYFDFIVGPDSDLPPKPSPAMIQYVMKMFPDCSKAFMVGDRKEDIQAANAAKVEAILMIHSENDGLDMDGAKPDYTAFGFKNLETIFRFGEKYD